VDENKHTSDTIMLGQISLLTLQETLLGCKSEMPSNM